ncbi:uncharacterized protein THITE_2109177 [Thermothielavioides terrestris NRRL 8126]|jgi:hypothetical protein|uniref:Uncharacterized protein n=1 Tax=Thermothielavioides terrestris (strain ATCC 38088 / NRRL 8126) TaxID=578455 RepID=G2QTY5_THETT|nr:uncharacterized protein THITE_2109177 [Thermothielavioides terrestris NRRL 8126]AEO63644.1 hypothetical protein THITE_2109177 [Thermothielavioides terrestris NRRL 8126]
MSTADGASLDDEDRRAPNRLPPAFAGYRPFPPVLNLYGNPSGVIDALTTLKLCGAAKSDLLYIVEVHHGFTPRGPLHFRPGLYLRNGPSTDAPILAAAGDEAREPLLMSTFSVKSFIMLPPLDLEANPRDMVTEIMYATKTSDGAVSFRFAIEVGPKMKCREHFEWKKAGTDNGHSRYILVRLDPRAASPSPAPSAQDESEVLAELLFRNVMSWNHLFTLELKGAGGSGAMGDRWTLMVVVSALRLYWLRVYGKTNKSVVGIGQKFRGK